MNQRKEMKAAAKNPATYKREKGLHPRLHAKALDRYFGFRIPKIELKLLQKYRAYDKPSDDSSRKRHYEGAQTWIGLHPQALQTSYNEIYEALSLVGEMDVRDIVDIGAGYGRVGLVMNSLFPEANFTGFEILKQRESEGNRVFESLGLDNCEIILENVLNEDFVLPKAQIYFIYDFSEITDISRILDTLSERINDHSFILITKGDRVDYLLARKYKHFWNTNGFLSSGDLKLYSSIKDINELRTGEKNGDRKS